MPAPGTSITATRVILPKTRLLSARPWSLATPRTLRRGIVYASWLLVLCDLPCQAHHASNMFDPQKEITLTGTVREFQFTNPHCYIQLVVAASTAGTPPVEWSIEMGAPAHLVRHGWKRNTLQPGDRITVHLHPLKSGGDGGLFMTAADSNGNPLGT